MLLLAISVQGYGQVSPMPEWISQFAPRYDVFRDVVYDGSRNIENRLDVYVPRESTTVAPCFIWFHGGGWGRLSKDSVKFHWPHWLSKGWVVVNVDYRLSGTAPAPAAVSDCRCAIRWVFANAVRLRIDTSYIVLGGTSAGAHLALMTGFLPDGAWLDSCRDQPAPRIAGIVNFYGITEVNDLLTGVHRKGYAARWIGSRADSSLMARDVSPLTYVRAGLPPVFTVHGDADTTVPYEHALKLRAALDSVHVPNRLMTIHGGFHGKFGTQKESEVYSAIDEFLELVRHR